MSKFELGVGDEFPLDEGRPEPHRHGGRQDRHHHRHHHDGHHGHRHMRHGILHLPLFLAVAGIAALIGAGKIPLLATEAMVGLAVIAVLLAVVAHFRHHRHWHADQRTQCQKTQ